MLGKRRDVLAAIAKGRHQDREHAQPVVEILAEASGLHLGLEIPVGGSYHPDVDLDRPIVTDPSKQQAHRLRMHRWPGNIRELRNVIERAVILATGNRARLDLAMSDTRNAEGAEAPEPVPRTETGFVTDAEMRQRERANLIAALQHTGWRVWGPQGAAGVLGIKPSTLTYRMKALGITRPA